MDAIESFKTESTREGSVGREGLQKQKLNVGIGEMGKAEEAEKSGQWVGKKTRMVWCLGSQVKKAFEE